MRRIHAPSDCMRLSIAEGETQFACIRLIVSVVIVGLEHSMWNITLAVLQSGRTVPQSGEAVVGCGIPCCVNATNILPSEQLTGNGTVSLLLLVEIVLFCITHLRLLVIQRLPLLPIF